MVRTKFAWISGVPSGPYFFLAKYTAMNRRAIFGALTGLSVDPDFLDGLTMMLLYHFPLLVKPCPFKAIQHLF